MPHRQRPGKRRSIPFPYDSNDVSRARIEANFKPLAKEAIQLGRTRPGISDSQIREWHRRCFEGVSLANPAVAGHYRGSPASDRLRVHEVRIGPGHQGRPARLVAQDVRGFLEELCKRVAILDGAISPGTAPPPGSTNEAEVVKLAVLAHGQWIRIHPFVDCNGSTGRLWIMYLAARYRTALVMQAKPRPNLEVAIGRITVGYSEAADAQMDGSDLRMQLWLAGYLKAIQSWPPS
ncbi:MAG: Fic family protein [Candidatus Dormibacteria bacterium]